MYFRIFGCSDECLWHSSERQKAKSCGDAYRHSSEQWLKAIETAFSLLTLGTSRKKKNK